MKRSLEVLFFLLFVLPVTAQLNLNKGYIKTKEYHHDIDAIFENDKLLIEAEIGGVRSRFIIDTGAPLCISKACQEKNQFKVLQEDSILDANGLSHITKIVNVNELKIGNIIYKDIPAIVIEDETPVFECANATGLIGSNLLRFGTIQIDWKKQRIILTKSYKNLNLKRKDGEKLLVNEVQSSPYLTINVGAKITDRLLIDTGSDDFYSFSKKGLDYVQSKGYLKDAVKYKSIGSTSTGLFGPDMNASDKLIKIDSLTIGKMAHLHEFYAVTTNDDQSRIGVYLLSQGVVTIDYPNGLFFFQLYENDFKYEYSSFGFEPVKQGDKLIVGSIWKGSEAELSGLAIGDEIVDIEGLNVSEKGACFVFNQYKKSFSINKNITVHIKKTGKNNIKQVKLERMKL